METSRPEPKLWNKSETAAFLNVSARTVDNWCAARILPFVQLPCGKRFDPDRIKAFLKSRAFDSSAHLDRQDSARVS